MESFINERKRELKRLIDRFNKNNIFNLTGYQAKDLSERFYYDNIISYRSLLKDINNDINQTNTYSYLFESKEEQKELLDEAVGLKTKTINYITKLSKMIPKFKHETVLEVSENLTLDNEFIDLLLKQSLSKNNIPSVPSKIELSKPQEIILRSFLTEETQHFSNQDYEDGKVILDVLVKFGFLNNKTDGCFSITEKGRDYLVPEEIFKIDPNINLLVISNKFQHLASEYSKNNIFYLSSKECEEKFNNNFTNNIKVIENILNHTERELKYLSKYKGSLKKSLLTDCYNSLIKYIDNYLNDIKLANSKYSSITEFINA